MASIEKKRTQNIMFLCKEGLAVGSKYADLIESCSMQILISKNEKIKENIRERRKSLQRKSEAVLRRQPMILRPAPGR